MSNKVSGQVAPGGAREKGDKYALSVHSDGLHIGFNKPFENPPIALVTASGSEVVTISTEVSKSGMLISWSGGTPDFFTFYVTDQGLGYY